MSGQNGSRVQMDGESGGACPAIESKFHSYATIRACNRRDETIDRALTSALAIASNVR